MGKTSLEIIEEKISRVQDDLVELAREPKSEFRDDMYSELYTQLKNYKKIRAELQEAAEQEAAEEANYISDDELSGSNDDGEPSDADKKEKKGLRDIELPTALQSRYIKGLLTAILVGIITVVLLIVYKEPQYCIGFVLTGYLIYLAISMKFDYNDGKIAELAVICASISPDYGRHRVRATFRTEDDPPKYYSFLLSGSKRDNADLLVNYVYIIYFKPSDPNALISFIQL